MLIKEPQKTKSNGISTFITMFLFPVNLYMYIAWLQNNICTVVGMDQLFTLRIIDKRREPISLTYVTPRV